MFRDQLYLAYEIPKWDGDLGRPSLYVPLSEQDARHKVELLHKCFRPSTAVTGGTTKYSSAWRGCAAWSAGPATPRLSPARNPASADALGTAREGPDMTTLLIDPDAARPRTCGSGSTTATWSS